MTPNEQILQHRNYRGAESAVQSLQSNGCDHTAVMAFLDRLDPPQSAIASGWDRAITSANAARGFKRRA
jgi:hypothetical protein